jgi:hypothetical protein
VIIDNLDIDIRSLISLNSVMILNIFEVRGNPHPQPLSQVAIHYAKVLHRKGYDDGL